MPLIAVLAEFEANLKPLSTICLPAPNPLETMLVPAWKISSKPQGDLLLLLK